MNPRDYNRLAKPPRNPWFRWRIALALALGLSFVFPLLGAVPEAAVDGPWSGQIQCVLNIETSDYTRLETQTWSFIGSAPKIEAGLRIHEAMWTVSGRGSSTTSRGSQRVTTTWTVEAPPTPVKLATFIRASDQKLIVRQFGPPARVPNVVSCTRRVVVNGATQPDIKVTGDANEWSFRWIDSDKSQPTLSGSKMVEAEALPAEFAPPRVVPLTATSRWQLSRSAETTTPLPVVPSAAPSNAASSPRTNPRPTTKTPSVSPQPTPPLPSTSPSPPPSSSPAANQTRDRGSSTGLTLEYTLPESFAGNAQAEPAEFKSREGNAAVQIYPFRRFTGALIPELQRDLLRDWIDPRFRETGHEGQPEFYSFPVAGATAAYAARFQENIAGVLNERMRMVVVVDESAAIVDAFADDSATWQRVSTELGRLVDSVRVARRGALPPRPSISPRATPSVAGTPPNTSTGTQRSAEPAAPPRDPPPGTQRIAGVFLTEAPANVRPWILLFGADGRIAGETLDKLVKNPTCPSRGQGTYEIRDGSVFIVLENGFATSLPIRLEGADPLVPQQVVVNGFVFKLEQEPPVPLPPSSTQ